MTLAVLAFVVRSKEVKDLPNAAAVAAAGVEFPAVVVIAVVAAAPAAAALVLEAVVERALPGSSTKLGASLLALLRRASPPAPLPPRTGAGCDGSLHLQR